MLFNSLDFIAFFAAFYGLYLLLPHRGQNILLLVGSYVFYASWNWRFLGLLVLSTVVDFVLANLIDATNGPRRRKALLCCSMCVSLGVLGFFKYFNFFVGSLAVLLGKFGWHVEAAHLAVILPWGISFYTFQTMNYTIDVYRRHLKPAQSLIDFAVFVSFFPHLVAGPIMRATALLPQVLEPRVITRERIREGAWLVLFGLFKKMVIADNLAEIADRIFSAAHPSPLMTLAGVYAFAFQIYGDFSGYSDIARGISKFMGFELMINFNNPYFATNPADFWRRWHISLSTWLRDYLYIPLGGNRKGAARTYVNLATTMLLGGLWHGAAWTYVFWGAYQGLLLIVHRLFTGETRREKVGAGWPRIWRTVVMFHAVCIGWLLFRARSMGQVGEMLASFVRGPWHLGRQTASDFAAIALLILPLLLVQLLQESAGDLAAPLRLSLLPRAAMFSLLMLLIVCIGNTGSRAFIYFQF